MSTLHTDRLRFELYTDRDKANFIELLTDPAVMRFVENGPLNIDQADALWRKLMREFYPDGVDTIWAVFAKDDGRYVGNASLRPRPERQQDWEIGYYLKPGEWGKASEPRLPRGWCVTDSKLPVSMRSTQPWTPATSLRFIFSRSADWKCIEKNSINWASSTFIE
jgi:hypothetical protein